MCGRVTLWFSCRIIRAICRTFWKLCMIRGESYSMATFRPPDGRFPTDPRCIYRLLTLQQRYLTLVESRPLKNHYGL